LVTSDPFELIDSLIEEAGGSGSELIVIVEQSHERIDVIDLGQTLCDLAISLENVQSVHTHIGETLIVVVVFVDLVEGDIFADGLAECGHCSCEVGVLGDADDIRVTLVCLLPVVLFVAELRGIGAEVVPRGPGGRGALLDVDGERVELGTDLVEIP